jgi:amidophosphoribosyltransferase
MCGIIGVISKENRPNLGALICYGLYQVQNRGDYSAGIATIKKLPVDRKTYRRLRRIAVESGFEDFDSMVIRKGRGKVYEVFDDNQLAKLTGFMGVGQVRYPTAGYTVSSGVSAEENAALERESVQPVRTKDYSKIAMVHNGDIHNYSEVMEHFNEMGLKKVTNNDVEAILKVFAEEFFDLEENIPEKERIARAVAGVHKRVKGTYCVLAAMNNVGLVAFRDPEGRRPLFFGVNANGAVTDYAFASETVALEKMLFKGTLDQEYASGDKVYDEVKPGEMVFISKDFEVVRKQISKPRLKFCPFEAPYFMRASSFVNNRRVKKVRQELITQMLEGFKKDHPDTWDRLVLDRDNTIICPVPRTADTAAIHLADTLKTNGFHLTFAIEKNAYSGRIFMQPTQKHRDVQTISNHYIFKEEVRGKNIILIDDSIVRGTTLKHDIKYLKDLNAKSVHVLITFPAITAPCNHAVDFHTPEELFAYNHRSEAERKEALGLGSKDTLFYASPEHLTEAIGIPRENLCDECYKSDD